MRVRRIIWSITIPLVVLTIGALALSEFMSGGVVSGQAPPDTDTHLPPFQVKQDQDEIDPEACATVVHKEIEGPITSAFSVIPDFPQSPATGTVLVIRQQMIVKVIQACNVDDEIEPPNLERDLDIDIEIFSIICEKRQDLSVTARCEIFRVAQEDNAGFEFPLD